MVGMRTVCRIYRLNEGLAVRPIELEQELWSGRWYVGIEVEGGLFGHYMKPKHNTSPSFSHS